MDEATTLAGRLLLALPGMGDPRFARATIALCVHDANGAFGLDVGSVRAGVTFHDLLRELEIAPGVAPDCPVLHGGPVEPGRGFVLHSPDWIGGESLRAGTLGVLSASLEILRAIAAGHGPRQWVVALGYAGWGPGQLENEMRHHGWHAAAGHASVVYETPVEERWTAAWRAEGIDPALLASQTGRA